MTASFANVAAASFRRSVVCLGDSITQEGWGLDASSRGWVAALAHAYRRKADLINRGFSGYNSRWALLLAPHVFAPQAAGKRNLIATIFFGANDSVDPVRNSRQDVPLEEYEENLVSLGTLAAASSEVVAIIAPPPVDSAAWPDRSNSRTRAYASAAGRAAARVRSAVSSAQRVVFVDTFTLCAPDGADDADAPSAPWRSYLRDGLHLSAAGNQLLADALLQALGDAAAATGDVLPLPLLPDALPLDFPLHRTVAPETQAAWRDAFTASALAELHRQATPA